MRPRRDHGPRPHPRVGHRERVISSHFKERAIRFDDTAGARLTRASAACALSRASRTRSTRRSSTRPTCRPRSAPSSARQEIGDEPDRPRGQAAHARGRLPRPDRPRAARLEPDEMRRFNRGLMPLTIANIKSYLPRPFGALLDDRLPGRLRRPVRLHLLRRRLRRSPSAGSTRTSRPRRRSFAQGSQRVSLLELTDATKDDALAKMQDGKLDAIIVVPAGLGASMASGRRDERAVPAAAVHGPEQVDRERHGPAGRGPGRGRDQPAAERQAARARRAAADTADAEPDERRVLRAQHPCHGAHAAGHLRCDPARRAAREADPQASWRTPLPRSTLVGSNVFMRLLIALVQTLIIVGIGVAPVRREHPPATRRRRACHPGRGHLRVDRLRHRVLRANGGLGQRARERRPVPAHVPVRDLLSHRVHAAVAPARRGVPAADLPGRRAAPDDGRRRAHTRRCTSTSSSSPAGSLSRFLISARYFRWQ